MIDPENKSSNAKWIDAVLIKQSDNQKKLFYSLLFFVKNSLHLKKWISYRVILTQSFYSFLIVKMIV